MNTAEGLRETLAQIDQLLEECENRPGLDRFVQHLKQRRESIEREIRKLENKE